MPTVVDVIGKEYHMSLKFTASSFACTAVVGATAIAQPTIGPQIRVDPGGGIFASNETSIAAVNSAPGEIVATWNDWRMSPNINSEIINMGVAVSIDNGATWNDFLVRPPVPNQSTVEGDPMTAYDQRTGNLWVGAISFAFNGGLYVARKAPGDATFQPSVNVGQNFFADKCWMAAGPLPNNPNSTAVYIAYNEGLVRSVDLGQTWNAPVSIASGIGFLPRVGPDGTVYVTYWDFGFGVRLRASTDGGLTFGPARTIATRLDSWSTQDGSRFPGNMRVPPMHTLAVHPKTGDLYCCYFDTTSQQGGNRNVDMYFTKSTDGGINWTTPAIINDDAGNANADSFFPWLEVDNYGRLHLVMYDTRHTVQNDNSLFGSQPGLIDAYYLYSLDDGDTWTENRLTSAPFDCDDDGLNRSQQFIGDYNGLTYSQNVVWPLYLSTQNGDSDSFVHKIEWPALTLAAPVPGTAGQNNTLSVSNAVPNEQVYFGYGFNAGSSPILGCPGASVDISNPKLAGSAMADANGDASLVAFVPDSASGRTIRIQAVQTVNCAKTNLVVNTF